MITKIISENEGVPTTVEVTYLGDPKLPVGVAEGETEQVSVRSIRPFVYNEMPVILKSKDVPKAPGRLTSSIFQLKSSSSRNWSTKG